VFPASWHFCTAGHLPADCGQFLPRSTISLGLKFLKIFPLRRTTAARRDTFLPAEANFLRDPQSPRVSSFGSPRGPAAKFRPLCRFASFHCGSASDSMSTKVGSSHSRCASVVSWQDIVSLRHALREWIAASSLESPAAPLLSHFLLDLAPSPLD
jgi:hypothetical protein